MNILITGATKGIGKAIAQELQTEHEIHVASRNENLLRNYDKYCVCDLATKDGIEKLGKYIEDSKIDVLINNAGEYLYTPALNGFDFDEVEHITRLNLEAPLYLTSKAIAYMKQNGFGRIVNIGSISGVMGEANASLYSATKSGLIGATKALALELAEYGITVNTINPGWVETELGNSSCEDSEFTKEELLECIPQRRFVEPKEIAGMVKYLISEEARGVTGQSINLCAGLSVGY
ncbi:MAG: SDR family oxidoreductase [Cyanobacteria bacterium SIG31]|nr:SDR family oxidoreductase [Cyanobacteria bacterium SIG31]